MITLWLATGALSAPQVEKPPTLTQGGSGGARKRWRIKIGDVVYSTYEEDWVKRPEPAIEPVIDTEDEPPQAEPAVQPSRPAWRGLSGVNWRNDAAENAAISARLAAIQTQHALERAYIELKAAETSAEFTQWQDRLNRAQEAMMSAKIEARRRAEMARLDEEEAIFALMLVS